MALPLGRSPLVGLAVFAGSVATAFSSLSEAPHIELPRAIEGTLENGLRVIVCPRQAEPLACVRLSFRAGTVYQAEGQRGAAWVAAQTLVHADGVDFAPLESAGGKLEVEVDLEHVDVAVVVPAKELPKAERFLADVVTKCTFKDEEIERGRKAANATIDAEQPATAAARALAIELAFERAPSLRGGSGPSDVAAAAVREFAKSNLRPASAVVSVVMAPPAPGQGDPGDAFNRLRETFGPWTRLPPRAFEPPVEPESTALRRGAAEHAKASAVAAAWRGPDRDLSDWAAFALIAELARGDLGSDVEVSLRSSMQGGSVLTLTRGGDRDALPKFEEDLLAWADRLAASDVADPTIISARERFAATAAAAMASASGLTRRLAHDELDREDWRAFEREYAGVLVVTRADVRRVASRFLARPRAATGRVWPSQQCAPIEVWAPPVKTFESGAKLVVEPRPGSGIVSIALCFQGGLLDSLVGPDESREPLPDVLAMAAREVGAIGEPTLDFTVDRTTLTFDVLAIHAEVALGRLTGIIAGEPASIAAEKLGLVAYAERVQQKSRASELDGLFAIEIAIRRGLDGLAPATRPHQLHGNAPWETSGTPRKLALAIVGDVDPGKVEAMIAPIAKPSDVKPKPRSKLFLTRENRHAVVSRVFAITDADVSLLRGLPTDRSSLDALGDLPGSLLRDLSVQTCSIGNSGLLVVEATSSAEQFDAADAALDSVVDALAKRGVEQADLDLAIKSAERARIEREATPRGRARSLAEDALFPPPAPVDAATATAALRRVLGSKPEKVRLLPKLEEKTEPAAPTPAPSPAAKPVVLEATPPASHPVAAPEPPRPDEMTIAQLEATFGKNLLEPDPHPDGYGPPKGAREVDVVRRWFGTGVGIVNGIINGDANLVDGMCEYLTMGFGMRHRDDPSKWAPAVADYASWSDDRKLVTVRIKKGIHWQFPAVDREDEKYRWLSDLFARERPELTTSDVAFTHRVIQDPGSGTGALRAVYEGSSVRPLDRYTYQVVWADPPIHAFVWSLSWQTLLPEFLFSRDESGAAIPPEVLGEGVKEHWYNRKACGYGPYEFVRLEPDQRIVLRRIDDFPIFQPAVREIRWEIIKDPELVAQRMLGGDLDGITLSPQQYRTYVANAKPGEGFKTDRFKTKPYRKSEYFYIGWNQRRPPFDDVRVRRALAHAIHREAIVKHAWYGGAHTIDTHLAPEHPYFHTGLKPIAFDLDAAARGLDEAGWKDANGNGVLEKSIGGQPMELRFTFLITNDSPESANLAAIVREDLKKLGIEMDVEALPWSDFQLRSRARDFSAMLGLWGTGYEVDFRMQFHSREAAEGYNYPGYASKEMDELTDRYMHAFDRKEQKEIAWRIQELLQADQPYAFLMRRDRMTVYASWLDHVEYSKWRPQLLSFGWCKAADAK